MASSWYVTRAQAYSGQRSRSLLLRLLTFSVHHDYFYPFGRPPQTSLELNLGNVTSRTQREKPERAFAHGQKERTSRRSGKEREREKERSERCTHVKTKALIINFASCRSLLVPCWDLVTRAQNMPVLAWHCPLCVQTNCRTRRRHLPEFVCSRCSFARLADRRKGAGEVFSGTMESRLGVSQDLVHISRPLISNCAPLIYRCQLVREPKGTEKLRHNCNCDAQLAFELIYGRLSLLWSRIKCVCWFSKTFQACAVVTTRFRCLNGLQDKRRGFRFVVHTWEVVLQWNTCTTTLTSSWRCQVRNTRISQKSWSI